MHRSHRARVRVLLFVTGLVMTTCWQVRTPDTFVLGRAEIAGPIAWLLADSTELGPAEDDSVRITAALNAPTRPAALIGWASRWGLRTQWVPGRGWASISGPATRVAAAFGVPIDDYRSRTGQAFYASSQQPVVPDAARGEVAAVGRVLGYRTAHAAKPTLIKRDVPTDAKGNTGLTPDQLLASYDAGPLKYSGFTGKGKTVVLFELDGFNQSDLDAYADMMHLPRFTPTVIGAPLQKPEGETAMDLEVVHAIAPDAHLVIFTAPDHVDGYQPVADLMSAADRQFPGAVWSSSIGWACDRIDTAADLAPLRDPLQAAGAHGTSVFDSSGDSGGFECKGGKDWSTPPGESDRGLDSMASVPEITDVGGTTLSTDVNGNWVAEATWVDSPMSQGTGGGISELFSRPDFQNAVTSSADSGNHRLTPDVAADADPYTGVTIVSNGETVAGGGTSQSAPIWAGLTVLIDQYLEANGGHPAGAMNPLLYRVAAAAARPAFHDVTVAGNALYPAEGGYDVVTGLGSPDASNLAADLLDLQRGRS